MRRQSAIPRLPAAAQGGVTAAHIGLLAEPVLEQLIPAHEAALACITFAAGSELVLEQLRANARLVRWLSIALCSCSFVIVFVLMITLLTWFPASEDHNTRPAPLQLQRWAPPSCSRAPRGLAPCLGAFRGRSWIGELWCTDPYTQNPTPGRHQPPPRGKTQNLQWIFFAFPVKRLC